MCRVYAGGSARLNGIHAARAAGLAAILIAAAGLSRASGSHATRPRQAHWRRVSLIVRLNSSLTAPDEARLRGLGADIYRRLPVIHSVALRLPERLVPALTALPFVRHISADAVVSRCDQFTVGSSGAAVAWSSPYNLDGRGIGIAVVDSGVGYHNDLKDQPYSSLSRVVAHVNFAPGLTNAIDGCGHGTHVAGIIAGNGHSSSGAANFRTFYGIARRANIIDVRVLDNDGQGTLSSVIAGIQWAMAHAKQYNIRVMNLSLGYPPGESYATDPLCQACEQAWNAGIVVVCAAGNAGRLSATALPGVPNEGYGTAYGSIQAPGNDPLVITVGATKSMDGTRADDRIATYSGRGPTRLDYILKPDIVAPGNRVISLEARQSYLENTFASTNDIPLQYYCHTAQPGPSRVYFSLSGTSMAAPVAAGAAALMIQADPGLSPDTVKARLMIAADKWADPTGAWDPCTYGAGYIDIPASLACRAVATAPALSPPLARDGAGNVSISSVLWGSSVWGTGITDLHVIWGSNVVWGSSVLWGSNVVWGASVWADHVVWGTDTSSVDLSDTAINGE